MVLKSFTLNGGGKGKIETTLYKRPPKGCPKFDIIRLTCTHEDGYKFADFSIYPEEAMLIVAALTAAWTDSYVAGMQGITPDNYKTYKPFQGIPGMEKKK